ncbi:flavoprotein, partial [Micromonospora craterilacus]
MKPNSLNNRLLYLVVCAAPPARHITELVEAVQRDGWDVHVIATETAHTWLPTEQLAAATGQPVSYRQRQPHEPSGLPRADAIAVVPATFNTINKWATGINDSQALGILNESLGADLPIIASPYVKP